MHLFKVNGSIGHIPGIFGLIDMGWKESASIGYWVSYVTSTFDLTHDFDIKFLEVNFWLTLIF